MCIRIIFLILTGLWVVEGAVAQELELRGSYDWQASRAEFGGLSGVAMDDLGKRIYAISDKGVMFIGDVERENGLIQNITVSSRHALQDTKGQAPRKFLQNSEGLALNPSGGFYVAYEGWSRIWAYSTPDSIPEWTHVWDRFWDQNGNTGFEALAIDAERILYVISEKVIGNAGAFEVFRYDGENWHATFRIPQNDGYLISGADFGPDGRLYIAERIFRWHKGFATRIRRIDLTDESINSDVLLLDSPFGELGNTEGISVWRDASGTVIVTLISDDNFNPLQRTQVTEYRLLE